MANKGRTGHPSCPADRLGLIKIQRGLKDYAGSVVPVRHSFVLGAAVRSSVEKLEHVSSCRLTTDLSITPQYVQKRVQLLERQIEERLRKLEQTGQAISELAYLVFDVSPDLAWSGLPISIFTYDQDKRELDCELHCEEFLPEVGFLDPQFEYPLGRVDWLGADTTGDYQMVLDELVAFFTGIYGDIRLPDSKFSTYIGDVLYDEDHNMLPSQLRNLITRQDEVHCFCLE